MLAGVGAVDLGRLTICQYVHSDAFVCCVEKGLPQLEVFDEQFWDADLAFEASGRLEFTEAAEKMSSCGEDISDVV